MTVQIERCNVTILDPSQLTPGLRGPAADKSEPAAGVTAFVVIRAGVQDRTAPAGGVVQAMPRQKAGGRASCEPDA